MPVIGPRGAILFGAERAKSIFVGLGATSIAHLPIEFAALAKDAWIVGINPVGAVEVGKREVELALLAIGDRPFKESVDPSRMARNRSVELSQ